MAQTENGEPRSPVSNEEVVVFELSGQRYALLSSAVREVVRAFSAVPLPKAPPLVEGILNVRGEIIVLLNLRRRFGILEKPLSVSDHFIIAWDGVRWVALRVDRVLNLMRLPIRSLAAGEQALSLSLSSSPSQGELISGVGIASDGLVLIHDLPRFLSASEQELISQALAWHKRGPWR